MTFQFGTFLLNKRRQAHLCALCTSAVNKKAPSGALLCVLCASAVNKISAVRRVSLCPLRLRGE
jgi:hypothetical protein